MNYAFCPMLTWPRSLYQSMLSRVIQALCFLLRRYSLRGHWLKIILLCKPAKLRLKAAMIVPQKRTSGSFLPMPHIGWASRVFQQSVLVLVKSIGHTQLSIRCLLPKLYRVPISTQCCHYSWRGSDESISCCCYRWDFI